MRRELMPWPVRVPRGAGGRGPLPGLRVPTPFRGGTAPANHEAGPWPHTTDAPGGRRLAARPSKSVQTTQLPGAKRRNEAVHALLQSAGRHPRPGRSLAAGALRRTRRDPHRDADQRRHPGDRAVRGARVARRRLAHDRGQPLPHRRGRSRGAGAGAAARPARHDARELLEGDPDRHRRQERLPDHVRRRVGARRFRRRAQLRLRRQAGRLHPDHLGRALERRREEREAGRR